MAIIKQYGKSKIDYICGEQVVALNLNAVLPKLQFSTHSLVNVVKDFAEEYDRVELCGLSDLCYRLDVGYSSDTILDLMITLKRFFKRYFPYLHFVQEGFEFDGSYGIMPLTSLYQVDRVRELVFVHKILLDKMRILGFANVQLNEVLNTIQSVEDLLPPDVVASLPLMSEVNVDAFNRYCEVLGC